MRRLPQYVLLIVLVALGARVVDSVVSPLLPTLIVTSLLVVIFLRFFKGPHAGGFGSRG